MAGRDKHYFRNLISSTFDEIIQDLDSAQVDLSHPLLPVKYVQLEFVFTASPRGGGTRNPLRISKAMFGIVRSKDEIAKMARIGFVLSHPWLRPGRLLRHFRWTRSLCKLTLHPDQFLSHNPHVLISVSQPVLQSHNSYFQFDLATYKHLGEHFEQKHVGDLMSRGGRLIIFSFLA